MHWRLLPRLNPADSECLIPDKEIDLFPHHCLKFQYVPAYGRRERHGMAALYVRLIIRLYDQLMSLMGEFMENWKHHTQTTDD